jgi:predicted permease
MPLALVALGSSLQYRVIRSELVPALWVSSAKLLVHPALVWLLMRWWGVDSLVEQGMLLCMATPAAVAGHVMAVEMRGDAQLSAAVVMVTTALSAVTLPLWLAVVLAW